MSEYQAIKISKDKAKDILKRLYQIEGTAKLVHGEVDFNFRIDIADEAKYILKISRPDEVEAYLDFQNQLLAQLELKPNIPCAKVIADKEGGKTSTFIDELGNKRFVRLLTWAPGRLWCDVHPQTNELRFDLGKQAGQITQALQEFRHPLEERELVWDIAQALWTTQYTQLFKDEEFELVSKFQRRFTSLQDSYAKLRRSVVHNDVNDHNIVVSNDLLNPNVEAIFDYGDAMKTQIINDLAIACAYAMKDFNDPLEAALPLIAGYHQSFPLLEEELDHLYIAIAMRLIISVTKAELNRVAEPDNKYLQISRESALKTLRGWSQVNEEYATYSFRKVCGFTAHPNQYKFKNWAKKNQFSLEDLFPTVARKQITPLDLSVSSTWLGNENEFNDLDLFQYKLGKLQKENPDKIIAGGYLEARALYLAPEYDSQGNHGRQSRTIHLGIDYWLPALTPVHAVLDGEVVVATDNVGDKQYGGLVILKHSVEDFEFYSLYGHLNVASAISNKVGDIISKGQQIALLGAYPENGNWATHLHFQLMLSMLDYENDFAGVAFHHKINVWKSICPDPNLLFKVKEQNKSNKPSKSDLISYRKQHLGKGMSLQYAKPLKIVRGHQQYLIDEHGRKYLDTVNNVAHVGHEHPDVVKAGQEQMALLNTNTRYLNEKINQFAQELLETFPKELSVVHFVNSGSEANELALRMAKVVTGQKNIIASQVGYHGNTNATIDVSSYKFDGKGGQGIPEFTSIFPLPDAFRGKHRGESSAENYAKEVKSCVDAIQAKGEGVAGLILEPILSCGGQVELPKGFLGKAYQHVREAGGLCISDEVQTGCGRMGKTFWGFQLHDVIPDIVTIGKPLGNGHPVAAVVCTQAVANQFANGMEYFNTFGGNPVSSAIGAEVLKVVKREKLQENALTVGEFLKTELIKLKQQYPIIADVRGQGFFLGVEFLDKEMQPLAEQCDYVINRMKDFGILMSSDGPDHNVLKIKPPMIFSRSDADELIGCLEKVLQEDFLKD